MASPPPSDIADARRHVSRHRAAAPRRAGHARGRGSHAPLRVDRAARSTATASAPTAFGRQAPDIGARGSAAALLHGRYAHVVELGGEGCTAGRPMGPGRSARPPSCASTRRPAPTSAVLAGVGGVALRVPAGLALLGTAQVLHDDAQVGPVVAGRADDGVAVAAPPLGHRVELLGELRLPRLPDRDVVSLMKLSSSP